MQRLLWKHNAINEKLNFPMPTCPQCGSKLSVKDGVRLLENGNAIQRFSCKSCGHRFTEHDQSTRGAKHPHVGVAQSLKPVKYVAKTQSVDNGLAGATADVKGKIVEFMWTLKRKGYSEATITSYASNLESLIKKGASLFDSDSVKDIIAMQETWCLSTKNNVAKAYTAFLKSQGLKWQPPKYKPPSKLPFIPTENEIDDLIAGCSPQMATFLQLLKETAMRRGEAYQLKWVDIDQRSNTVRVTPEKGSNPRIFKISNELMAMLNNLPKTSEKVFSYKRKHYLGKTFRKQRKRIAHKLKNPRILRIHFHTLRHWKATMEYHKTKDILHVMQLLGHKNIANTLKYTQLVNFKTDEYACKVAKTLKEATKLIEAGFEYVTEMDSYKLFKKRK